jgi:hypothetical protein
MSWYRIELEIDDGDKSGSPLFHQAEDLIRERIPEARNVKTNEIALKEKYLSDGSITCPSCGYDGPE